MNFDLSTARKALEGGMSGRTPSGGITSNAQAFSMQNQDHGVRARTPVLAQTLKRS